SVDLDRRWIPWASKDTIERVDFHVDGEPLSGSIHGQDWCPPSAMADRMDWFPIPPTDYSDWNEQKNLERQRIFQDKYSLYHALLNDLNLMPRLDWSTVRFLGG
ncbi:hypothetical protein BGZ83_011408, partial [Gryganskiella cystojenkinii]